MKLDRQITNAWLATLNTLLSSIEGLGPAVWLGYERSAIAVSSSLSVPKAAVSVLLAAPDAVAQLEAWPAEHDLTVAITPAGAAASTQIVVTKGRIWLFSSAAKPEATSDGPFLGWFEDTFGRPFPIPEWAQPLHRLAPSVWASGGSIEDILGFPHPLWIRGHPVHRLVSFAGYGVNSYACYFTDVEPRSRVLLRMPFGGVFGNPKEQGARLAQEIADVHAVTRELRALGLFFVIEADMGHLQVGFGRVLPEELLQRQHEPSRGFDAMRFEKHFLGFHWLAVSWSDVLAAARQIAGLGPGESPCQGSGYEPSLSISRRGSLAP